MAVQKTYKELQEELEIILDKFEHSAHEDVDELLKDYDAGKQLIAELEKQLQQAELTLKKAK
jgi:exonuclease VII small subunit